MGEMNGKRRENCACSLPEKQLGWERQVRGGVATAGVVGLWEPVFWQWGLRLAGLGWGMSNVGCFLAEFKSHARLWECPAHTSSPTPPGASVSHVEEEGAGHSLARSPPFSSKIGWS